MRLEIWIYMLLNLEKSGVRLVGEGPWSAYGWYIEF